ncbi:aminoglycoside phosphotransferase family protein [uncultured Erythrobacter sp.]|uniref:phosphotransferase family protein n=1 Tax=uncultured Erythrobacter sp. TaxID=263913 RepID=UPI00262F1AFF|nr:aminoglycoside phosphotransferase family protein [uncultured Erythrobacter sp.]
MGENFPKRPEEVTGEWLSNRLEDAGLLSDGHVTAIDHQSIGTGQVGDSIRFTLTYSREGAGPPSIAGKFAASDPTSRATAQMMKLYLHEVGFFRELADQLPVRTPRPIYADIADDNGDFILLMEDLGTARQGNQLTSCSLDDARHAICQAAALHGPSWGRGSIIDAPFIQPDPQISAMAAALYPKSTATFVERYSGDIPAHLMAIVHRLGELAEPLFDLKKQRKSLVHGDFRLDNMLFDICGGKEPLAIVDWQTLRPGDGAEDIGYFMGAGIGSDLRRRAEDELLDLYCEQMGRHGVDVSRSAIERGYRLGAIHGVSTAVFSAANVVRTERGDENFLSMAMGALELVQDTGALALIEEA